LKDARLRLLADLGPHPIMVPFLARGRPSSPVSQGGNAILYAFDLVEHEGDDLRESPCLDREAALVLPLRKAGLPSPADLTHRGH
jgi:ATP-dependent DNA ligase